MPYSYGTPCGTDCDTHRDLCKQPTPSPPTTGVCASQPCSGWRVVLKSLFLAVLGQIWGLMLRRGVLSQRSCVTGRAIRCSRARRS